MLIRTVPLLALEALEKLSTRQLLARLQRLRECVDCLNASDLTPDEAVAATGILFKSQPEWSVAFRDLETVLATREHVPRAGALQSSRKRRPRR